MGLKALEGHNDKDQNMDKIEINDTASNDSVLETSSFIEEMKKDKEDDTIIVDDVEPHVDVHKNGEMSIGDTPQTLSPTRLSNQEVTLEPLDVDPPSTAADSDIVMNDGLSETLSPTRLSNQEVTLEPLDVDPPSTAADSDIVMNDGLSENGSMQVEPSNSPLSGDMMVEPTELTEPTDDGAQEPWVFRGGLTADLRRLLPIECSGDVLRPQIIPDGLPLTVRPYTTADEEAVIMICNKMCRDSADCADLFPSDLQNLPADRLVASFLTLCPELCMVIEDDSGCIQHEADTEVDVDDSEDKSESIAEVKLNGIKPEIVGYACAALNAKEFYRKQEVAWIPEMCQKYPQELLQRDDLSPAAKVSWNYNQPVITSKAQLRCNNR
ncbi:Bifunctional protein NCOAT [Papilio xuthus]|uniref:Bifunctional protein NCOAT n=1 Tax=Papilio xuthus TaxID=66420 RepID=A0A0N1I4G4_PAPXU|nr:Bifunctional protein NCOAT [Papilio xuthus]